MTIQIIYQCPVCQERRQSSPSPSTAAVGCEICGWSRNEGERDISGGHLVRCRICGCEDLWRQKDFPPALGLALAGVAAALSCAAWAFYRPLLALGVLMVTAALDMILYTFMNDMLVCYRCRARHRRTPMNETHSGFDLETAERYRQQERNVRQSSPRA